jgi:hypothetical protein
MAGWEQISDEDCEAEMLSLLDAMIEFIDGPA